MKQDRFRSLLRLPRADRQSADAQWMISAGGVMLLVFVFRVLFRQGWRSLALNRLQWLRLLRSFLRFLQLAAEISNRPPRGDD